MSHGIGASVNLLILSNFSCPSTLLVALGLTSVFACARHEADEPSVDTPAPITEQTPPDIPPVAQVVANAAPREPAQAGVQKPVESFLQPVGMPMSRNMAVGARWMQSLRDQNESALAQSTKYPFEWRSTAEQGCSAKQPATTVEDFSSVIGCVLATAPLTRVLVEHDRAGIVELPIGRLQPWAQVWREEVPPAATLVNAFIDRSDLQLDVDLWIVDGRVQAFWTNLVDGSAGVNTAKRWLQALKQRDLSALASVTSYPFEIRDTGRGAVCGSKAASNGEALRSATQCLFANKELRRSLATNGPFAESPGDGYEIPDWAALWFHPSRHSDLKKVSAGAGDLGSVSFDMVLLVDGAGVRALWMRGSQESMD